MSNSRTAKDQAWNLDAETLLTVCFVGTESVLAIRESVELAVPMKKIGLFQETEIMTTSQVD